MHQVDVAMGRGGQLGPIEPPVQGPSLPPNGMPVRKPVKPSRPALPAGMADALIGGAFPLLFGGGPGATFGGFAGGAIGGAMAGPAGMALSLAFSALGQQLDQALVKLKDIGNATKELNVDTLRDSFIFVNAELDKTVRYYKQANDALSAQRAIQDEITNQTGLGADAQNQITASVNGLQQVWDDVTGTVSSLVGIIAIPFVDGLATILNIITAIVKTVNIILSKLFASAKVLPVMTEEEQKRLAVLEKANEQRAVELASNTKILALEQQRTLGRTTAEKQINLELDNRIAREKISAEFDAKKKAFLEENVGLAAQEVQRGLNQLKTQEQIGRAHV